MGKNTALQSARNALLQTLPDSHPGFFEDLPFKHAILRSLDRVIAATRLEELDKLQGKTNFGKVLSKLQHFKEKHEKEEKIEKFNAVAQAISAVRELMPETPEAEEPTPPPVL